MDTFNPPCVGVRWSDEVKMINIRAILCTQSVLRGLLYIMTIALLTISSQDFSVVYR